MNCRHFIVYLTINIHKYTAICACFFISQSMNGELRNTPQGCCHLLYSYSALAYRILPHAILIGASNIFSFILTLRFAFYHFTVHRPKKKRTKDFPNKKTIFLRAAPTNEKIWNALEHSEKNCFMLYLSIYVYCCWKYTH